MNELSSHVRAELNKTFMIYRNIIAYRNDILFTKFLPEGYRYVTLNSVSEHFYDAAMIAKYHVGLLITLLDDFADNPKHLNSKLLREIYKLAYVDLNSDSLLHLNKREMRVYRLASQLIKNLFKYISVLPHFQKLQEIFKFDLQQFFHANRYAELLSIHNELSNGYECKQLRPFNMGMVMSGMIDIMASPNFNMHELGRARAVFHLGQRFSSLSNNMSTFSREWDENDITNELTVIGLETKLISFLDLKTLSAETALQRLQPVYITLQNEQQHIMDTLSSYNTLSSFSCDDYREGLILLHDLHESMRSVI